MKFSRWFLMAALLEQLLMSGNVYAQSVSYKNNTIYLSEVLSHTSPNDGNDVHFIGWLLNNSTLAFGDHHSLNVGLMMTHGGEPSVNIVNDLQVFSNLEAGFLYGFNEVYYEYQKSGFWLKIGQTDINSDFILTDNGLLFTHSSFGIDPAATLNMPAPTYPVTAFSISSQIPVTPNMNLRLGVFDGQFAEPKNDFLRIDWSLDKNEGFLLVIEPELTLLDERITQKIGFYHHSGLFLDRAYDDVVQNDIPLKRGLSAFYTITDATLKNWSDSKSLNLFIQTAWSQKDVSIISNYLGFGLKANNLFKTKGENEMGLAIAYANVNSEEYNTEEWSYLDSETVVEITYKQHVKNWLSLQPYFQYIGMKEVNSQEKNPVVFGFRMNWEFGFNE